MRMTAAVNPFLLLSLSTRFVSLLLHDKMRSALIGGKGTLSARSVEALEHVRQMLRRDPIALSRTRTTLADRGLQTCPKRSGQEPREESETAAQWAAERKGEGRRNGNYADLLETIAAGIRYWFPHTHTTSEPTLLLHPKMKVTLILG